MRTSKTGNGGRGGGNLTTFHTVRAPRRMFLCDVPIFLKKVRASGNDNENIVRLMGTVVDIVETSLLPLSNTQSTSLANAPHPIRLIHFVIDDGTGTTGVFTKRKVNRNNNCKIGSPYWETLPLINQSRKIPPTASKNTIRNHHLGMGSQPPAKVTLESILTSPPPPILVGQTVDCIGRLRTDTGEKMGANADNTQNDSGKVLPSPRIWLAASSVSLVKNPQAVTLRQLELSSTKRMNRTADGNNGRGHVGGIDNPNRILVGGSLQHKLNSLFHCNQQGSVVFNTEDAFSHIKYSKDDGGITLQELALLAGAVESHEMSAVKLAVEQLREDCRIYLNQGKWFPM